MEKKPTSGLAVASLVTGIIAIVSSFVPLLNLLSFPFVILAIVFGGIGIWQAAKGTKAGKGIAIAGLVCGVLGLLVTFAMYGGAAAVSDSSDTGADAPSSQQSAADDESSEPQAAEQASSESPYAVTIDGCLLTEDYEGNPAVTVTYTFTNNSDEATSPAVALGEKVFQNGAQCDVALVMDGSDNAGKSMNEVKPGGSITYDISYEIADTSDVTVEVEELFSWDDTLLAEQTFSLA